MAAAREWRWKKLSGVDESWRLLDERGRNRCSVWENGTWHSWDERGVGGENAVARNVNEAKEQATMAVIRQGWARLCRETT
jgi:hypothetical protein